MTHAVKKPGKPAVTKVVEVEPAIPGEVVLTMTQDEADALYFLVSRTSGMLLSDMYDALSAVRENWYSLKDKDGAAIPVITMSKESSR